MSFPIRRVEAEPGTCKHCQGETRCVNEEHVDDLLGVPLARKYMWFSRCRRCGMLDHARADKAAMLVGTAKGARALIAGTWVTLGLLLVACIACAIWNEQIERRHALSPIVGDRWTIEGNEWPTPITGAKYARVEVTEVYDTAIGFMACRMVYDDKSEARRECDSFDMPIFGVQRAQLESVYDDAVEAVDSSRDDNRPLFVGFGIVAALLFVWRIVAQHWKKRIAIADF